MLIDLKEFPLVYLRADRDSSESPERRSGRCLPAANALS